MVTSAASGDGGGRGTGRNFRYSQGFIHPTESAARIKGQNYSRQPNCMQLHRLPMSLIVTTQVGVGGDDGHER